MVTAYLAQLEDEERSPFLLNQLTTSSGPKIGYSFIQFKYKNHSSVELLRLQ